MAAPRIKCEVDACSYWDANNICRANEILVTANEAASGGAARTQFGQLGMSKKVQTSYETQCKTFTPKSEHGSDTKRR